MKKKKFLILTVVAGALVANCSIVSAVNENKAVLHNSFYPAEVINGVVENTGTETSYTQTVTAQEFTMTTNTSGTLSVDKPVEILNVDAENTNTADVFLRVSIVPMWCTSDSSESSDGNNNFVAGAMGSIINDDDNAEIVLGSVISNKDVTTTQTVTKNIVNVIDSSGSTIRTAITYEPANNNEYLDIASFGEFKNLTIDKDTNSFKIGDVTFTLVDSWNDYWIYNPNDGYFYYKYVVPVGEKTTQLLKSVSIDDSKFYRHKTTDSDGDTVTNPITLRVDILSDAVQALGGAVDDVWNAYSVSVSSETTTNISETTKHKYGYILETFTTTTTETTSSSD